MSLPYSKKDLLKSALKERLIKEFDYNTFENVKAIAKGGFGTVYCAKSTNLEKFVALKVLHENDESFHEKFLRELTNIMAVNNHDNIINFYGISIDPSTETHYLVLQYANDGDLRTYLRNNFKSLDWKIKIRMAKDIASGLRCIHRENIVHKDLHSKNILVHEGRLLITDLGLSQPLDANSNSMAGGMAAYTDPEYLRDQKKFKRNKPSDIYSLGALFWELSSGRPPFNNLQIFDIYRKVTSGVREKPINETPIDYIEIYSRAWVNDPNKRPTIENIYDSLENIKLENVYHETNDNHDIQSEAHINQSQTSTNVYSKDSVSILSSFTTSNLGEFTAIQESSTPLLTSLSTSLSTSRSTSLSTIHDSKDIIYATTKIAGSVEEAMKPFVPLIADVSFVIEEIIKVYENVQYNTKICNSLMDCVSAAETAIDTLKSRKTENEQNFRNPEYYKSFIRFIAIMKRIKEFMIDVSNINNYQKFVRSGSVKSEFNSLVKDFDVVMTELNFTMAITNEEQRKKDQSSLESDISDMTKFLERKEGGSVDQNQKINTILREVSLLKEKLDHPDISDNKANKIKSTELKNPLKSKATDRRGKSLQIFKKIYKYLEVACKPIDLQNSEPKEATKIQRELALLGKLRESPNIIRFYGLSNIENSDVMVFEWAEYGSLRELYCKHDIAWHGKAKIALDICRGLAFLHESDILHHDIRCENIMMSTGMVPKIANFRVSRLSTDATTSIEDIIDIMRWMAPEKLRDRSNHYTFKCEIFSFGMLLWELVFEQIPYENWKILKIKDHVLAGKREKITLGKAPPDVQKLQKGLTDIIVSVWQDDPANRKSLQYIFKNLSQLVDEYCTPDKENTPILLPDESLDLDGSLSPIAIIKEVLPIIPLEKGIAAHKKGEHAKAWGCFLEHADLNNATAKYWKGYYLWEGIVVAKDRKQASGLFKEAADEEIADAQLSYANSLVDNPQFDHEIFLKYMTKAANNNNPTAQFNLGEVYLYGKFNQKKDQELGKKYLRLAALNNQPNAKELLRKLGIDI